MITPDPGPPGLIEAVKQLVDAWDRRTVDEEAALQDLATEIEHLLDEGDWSEGPLGNCSLGATSIPTLLAKLL